MPHRTNEDDEPDSDNDPEEQEPKEPEEPLEQPPAELESPRQPNSTAPLVVSFSPSQARPAIFLWALCAQQVQHSLAYPAKSPTALQLSGTGRYGCGVRLVSRLRLHRPPRRPSSFFRSSCPLGACALLHTPSLTSHVLAFVIHGIGPVSSHDSPLRKQAILNLMAPRALLLTCLLLGISLCVWTVHGQTVYLGVSTTNPAWDGSCASTCTAQSPCSLPVWTSGNQKSIPVSDDCNGASLIWLAGDYTYTRVVFQYSAPNPPSMTLSTQGGVANFLLDSTQTEHVRLGFYGPGNLTFSNFQANGFNPQFTTNFAIDFVDSEVTFAPGSSYTASLQPAVPTMTFLSSHILLTSDFQIALSIAPLSLNIRNSTIESTAPVVFAWDLSNLSPITLTRSTLRNVSFEGAQSFTADYSNIDVPGRMFLRYADLRTDIIIRNSVVTGTGDEPWADTQYFGDVFLHNVTWNYAGPLILWDGSQQVYLRSLTLDQLVASFNFNGPFIGFSYPLTGSSVNVQVTDCIFTNPTLDQYTSIVHLGLLPVAGTAMLTFYGNTFNTPNFGLTIPPKLTIVTPNTRVGNARMTLFGATVSGQSVLLDDTIEAVVNQASDLTFTTSRVTIETGFSCPTVDLTVNAELLYRPTTEAGLEGGLDAKSLTAANFSLDFSAVTPNKSIHYPLAHTAAAIPYKFLAGTVIPSDTIIKTDYYNTTQDDGITRYTLAAPPPPTVPTSDEPTGDASHLHLSCALYSLVACVLLTLMIC